MARTGPHGALPIVLVEVGYVTLTAGIYAGMQQNALRLRSRLLGNLIVVVGVPGLSQTLDWFTHRLTHTAASGGTTLAVSLFAVLSALFHLHVMRNGGFLTGQGSSLLDDLRRVPRFIAGFVLRPVNFFAPLHRADLAFRLRRRAGSRTLTHGPLARRRWETSAQSSRVHPPSGYKNMIFAFGAASCVASMICSMK